MRVLITRPRHDAEPLAARLSALGIESLIEPLLFVSFLPGPPLDLSGIQALLVTSANGARALAARDERRHLPVFTVGDASARAAAECGFGHVESASGDVETLGRLVMDRLNPETGAVLHVAGSKVAGDLAGIVIESGFTYRREVLYETRKAERFSAAALKSLKAGALDGVLFFSPRTAAAFAALARQAGVQAFCEKIDAYCLSPAVAEAAAALAWRHAPTARRPDQDAMVDLLADQKEYR